MVDLRDLSDSLILNIISKCYNTYNISWLNDNGAV